MTGLDSVAAALAAAARAASIDASALALAVGLAFAIAAERRWPRRTPPRPSAARFLSNASLGVTGVLLGLALGPVAAGWSPFPPLLRSSAESRAAEIALIVLGVALLDLLRYLIHRLNHSVPALWRLHRVHHSDRELDVTTTFRHHPLEETVNLTLALAAVGLLGIPLAAVALHGALGWLLACWQHANARLPERLERALGGVVVTASIHAIHHSTETGEGNSNFGVLLSCWDRWFGSFADPAGARLANVTFGARDAGGGESLGALLLQPFRG